MWDGLALFMRRPAFILLPRGHPVSAHRIAAQRLSSTRRCTEWRPSGAVRQFESRRWAAIGELIVRWNFGRPGRTYWLSSHYDG